MRIGAEAVGRLIEGIGLVWNDAFGMGGDTGAGRKDYPLDTPTYPLLSDEERWKILLHDLSCLKPGWIRFMLPPEGITTKRGTIDTDSVHFERLAKVNAWAQAAGASIALDLCLIPRHLQMRGPDPAGGWAKANKAPADVDLYSRTFVRPVVSFLIEEMRLDQLRYISLVDEPFEGGAFHAPGADAFALHAAAHRAVRRDLAQRGFVPQRLQMTGPGTRSPVCWPIPDFHARGLDLDPYLDAYDEHCYVARLDRLPPCGNDDSIPMDVLTRHFLGPHAAYAARRNKPFFLSAIGTTYYGWRKGDRYGPSTHEAFITEAELIIRSMPLGVGGYLRYCFLNPGDIDGAWQLVDTADGSYRRCGHTFYGYANLCRYARQNSEVLAVETSSSGEKPGNVHACALRKVGGQLTILVVNDHECESATVELRPARAFASRKLQRIMTSRAVWHEPGPTFLIGRRSPIFADEIPPMCLAVYAEMPYEDIAR